MERRTGQWRFFVPSTLSPSISIPAVLWEPLEFPSYTSGPAKAQALKEEVDKMLQKGTIELVDHPGLGYYSPTGCKFFPSSVAMSPPSMVAMEYF